MHAESVEINLKSFNNQGLEIIRFCKENNISILNGLDLGEKNTYYRDNIHLNEKGQKFWAEILKQEIIKKL